MDMIDFNDVRAIRVWAIDRAMELNGRKEIATAEIVTVAETLAIYIMGGKVATDCLFGEAGNDTTRLGDLPPSRH